MIIKLNTFNELVTKVKHKMIKHFVDMYDSETLKEFTEKYAITYTPEVIKEIAEEHFLDGGRVFNKEGEDLGLYLLELNK